MPYWHKQNPWKDHVVYVPIEELAACCGSVGKPMYSYAEDLTFTDTIDKVLERWLLRGRKLDAYILPQPSGFHDMGVRYGPDGPDYLSPYGNQDKLHALLKKHTSAPGMQG